MQERLLESLRRIDAPTLRELVGETIVSAVEKVAPGDMEVQLAEILILKHKNQILFQKPLRQALIQSLSEPEALELAELVGVVGTSSFELYTKLIKCYSSFSGPRAEKLVEFLKLPNEYTLKPPVDTRPGKERIEVSYGETFNSKGYLHYYQVGVKDKLTSSMMKDGPSRLMVQMPTGAGKTFTALEMIVDLLRSVGGEGLVVWIVDSNELADQAFESFRYLWKMKGDRPIDTYRFFGGLAPDSLDSSFGVVFSSFASFFSVLNNPDHPKREFVSKLKSRLSLLVVDEAHSSTAPTYHQCINYLTKSAKSRLVGLTATPGRECDEEIDELIFLYDRNLIGICDSQGQGIDDPVARLQEEGYLAKVDLDALETNVTSAESNEVKVCQELAKNSQRNQAILDQLILARDAQESTLVFSCTLDHVYALKILCEHQGIASDLIVGDTPGFQRDKILERFRNEEFYVLINYDILSTGIDLPGLDKLIVTRPVGSSIEFSQILGRALRGPKNGGNERNKVITFKDNLLNYGDASMLFRHFWESWGV